VTDFWAPFFNPASKAKLRPGQTINEYCYEMELQQGKNIANAVATIANTTLELFVWSGLSNVKKWSKGKYTWVYHFDSKAAVTDYIQETLPSLAKKTSVVQIGWYADNWKKMPVFAPYKAADGVYELANYIPGDAMCPWVDTRSDTGKFVRGLSRTSPGKNLLGVSEMLTTTQFMELWGKVNGVPARYKKLSLEEFGKPLPVEVVREVRESQAYNAEFGWDGGEPGVLRPSDVSIFVTSITVYSCLRTDFVA
jgi:NmrA-like family